MAQLARISRGVRAVFRNLPSIRASSTYHSLPNDWLKKSNPWKVSSSYFNPNGITNPRPLFSPSSLPYATSTDSGTSKGKDKDDKVKNAQLDYDDLQNLLIASVKFLSSVFETWKLFFREGDTSKGKDDEVKNVDLKKVFKEQVRIQRILLDYDEPHNHIIDCVKVLSTVLSAWKLFRPNFELDYGVGDLETPRILFRLFPYLEVDKKKATSKKICMAEWMILLHLFSYGDPKFADQVLVGIIQLFKGIIEDLELECVDMESANKDKPDEEVHYPFPSTVIVGLKNYKMLISNNDDLDAINKEIDLWKKAQNE